LLCAIIAAKFSVPRTIAAAFYRPKVHPFVHRSISVCLVPAALAVIGQLHKQFNILRWRCQAFGQN
jgi:hypothetical protein